MTKIYDDLNKIYSNELFHKCNLTENRDLLFEMSVWLRNNYVNFDRDFDYILQHRDSQVVRFLTSSKSLSCVQRTLVYDILSYGDMNSFFACPNLSLSGVILSELGNQNQQDLFFDYVKKEKCRTFFAVTEPNKGSDAGSIETTYIGGKLSGKKWLIGAGAENGIGTVLCRRGQGPFDRCTLLLTSDILKSNRIRRERLQMCGTSGALLSYMEFNDLEVPEDCILGTELPLLESGLLATIKTFHRMRTCVAAMALGHCQAAIHYVEGISRSQTMSSQINKLQEMVNQARAMNLRAAATIDVNPLSRKEVALSKLSATQLAEFVIERIIEYLGRGALIEHPYLRRILQHSYGFEFMEGTSVVQKLSIYASMANHFIHKNVEFNQ